MDLADAARVLGGGAGLVPRGAGEEQARAVFALLVQVAAALGASAGATRVVTDAGWTRPERQIGTTGVTIDPDLYLALGVSGASQHTGGLGAPRHVVSVNTDPSCPMTAIADLGLICDAPALLVRLADRLSVPVAPEVRATAGLAGLLAPREGDTSLIVGAPVGTGDGLNAPHLTMAPPVPEPVDAVVVGAGPAGSAAALALARAGRSVVLLERGPYPGSKNVYGGVVYGRVLDEVIPGWWERVPVQRWVVRRSTMVMTPTQAVTIDVRTQAWGEAPYNGMTTYRADFDSWLAGEAVASGARLITSTVATGLRRDPDGRVIGIRTDRPDGDLDAQVVIACDGVNSFLAREAGLAAPADAAQHTLGVKEVLALPAGVIEERFGLGPDQGVDVEVVGCTRGIPGGGFLYTNRETVSVGVVVSVAGLAAAKVRPEDLIADFKAHPAIAPSLKGATLQEYAAHLIPEGGYDAMPTLAGDGLLVAGDAAGLTLAAGIWLEGVNFAIGSGLAAGQVAAAAIGSGDVSATGLAGYRKALDANFVLQDHRRLRAAPHLILSDRMQRQYTHLMCDIAEQMFTVTNPDPKPGLARLLRQTVKASGVRWRDLARDGLETLRVFR